MKKVLLIVLGVSLLFLCACGNTQGEEETTTEAIETEAYWENASEEDTSQPHSHDIEDCDCGVDFTLDDLPMRYMYYSLTYPHAQLVEDEEAYDKWYDEIVVTDGMDEMLLVSFVKQFNISKEDFEKANEEWIRIINEWGDTPVTPPFDTAHEAELCEVPNADVIYTFDNEFIKEYYKRENANVVLEIPSTAQN